jgi:hypothetical protein
MKREIKIKLNIEQIYCQEMGLIYITQDRKIMRIFVDKIMNCEFHKMLKNCEELTKHSSSLI